MLHVGVILSGCGFMDGSEVHEATLALYFLDKAGATVTCLAPNAPQRETIDHTNGQVMRESRNMLVEAARIARGKVVDVATARAADFDALVMPGGFGAAKNLCDFAINGARAEVHEAVARLVRDMHAARKPIGAICIAPALVAATFRGSSTHPELTIGDDKGTAAALESMGARHRNCPVKGFNVDETNLIVSTPAYMYDARISDVAAGIEKLVLEVLRLARTTRKLASTTPTS